jgi:class II lanthipeptide synthase
MIELLAALNLIERKALLERAQSSGLIAPSSPEVVNAWRSDPSFRLPESFKKRLEADGLNEADLGVLLSLTAEQIAQLQDSTPQWAVEIEESLRIVPRRGNLEWNPAASGDAPWMQVVGILDGFVQRSRHQFRNRATELWQHGDLPFTIDSAVGMVDAQICSRVSNLVMRTLMLELNVARLRGQLCGETAEARFEDFVAQATTESYVRRLVSEYPCLGRNIVETLAAVNDSNLEFFQNIATDWTAICKTFFDGGNPGFITKISGGDGDSHRGGRSVRIVEFASGAKIVYKPRGLGVDKFYNKVLRWVNSKQVVPPLYVPTLLDLGTHGWAEHIEYATCESPDALRSFYTRQGAHLALLYLFDAIDFHFENLIAAGEQPVLVDLEALFHPRPVLEKQAEVLSEQSQMWLVSSVMRTGLLPQRIRVQKDAPAWEVSGLGGEPGQLSPYRVIVLENHGTDRMRASRQHVPMPASRNRPMSDSGSRIIVAHLDDLVHGFDSVYRQAIVSRADLTGPDGLLGESAGLETRAILRPTNYYGRLLAESHHPDYLRDGCARDLLFDRLWQDVELVPGLARAIGAEQRALRAGDIPLFNSCPGELDLVMHDGERIVGFSERPSIIAVEEKILALGPDDLERQSWIIRASLATLGTAGEQPAFTPNTLDKYAAASPSAQDYEEMATLVGDRILAIGLETSDEMSWTGLTLAADGVWDLRPLGTDMYTGALGIGFFLAYAGAQLNNSAFTRSARKIALMVARHVETVLQSGNKLRRDQVLGIGAFGGGGSFLYGFAHLSTLLGERSLIDAGVRLIPVLNDLVDSDDDLDVIAGSAGCVLSALAFHPLATESGALLLARRCGDRILDRAERINSGIAWRNRMTASAPLMGFSHGTAGIATALLRLWEVSDEDAYRVAAMSAFQYERDAFDEASGNWPDFRILPGRIGTSMDTTWCHGASGVGIARLTAMKLMPDDRWTNDLEIAVGTTFREGFGGSDCLCHGNLGNLDFVYEAARTLERADWLAEAHAHAAIVLARIRTSGWRCGVPLSIEIPGLMTGLAGIGYGFLRLAFPDEVPSILNLEPVAASAKSVKTASLQCQA